MARRAITEAELEAARRATGSWNAAQLRAWGVPWPPPRGWRRKLMRSGVPAACPYPDGFKPEVAALGPSPNPLLAFATRPEPAPLPPDAIEIFTDGSCEPNPGPGGWGFAACRGTLELHREHGGERWTTNNRMELAGIIGALRWLPPAWPAIVWSDSHYAVRGCLEWRYGWRKRDWTRRGRRTPANADLWRIVDGLLEARTVDVRWARGHAGTAGNERADGLARLGRSDVQLFGESPLATATTIA